MNLKILFFPLALMLSVIILIWMAKPEWDNLKSNQAELAVAQEALDKVDSQVNALDRVAREYKDLGDDKQLILNALPFEPRRDDVIAEVYQKVKESEVLLTQLSSDASAAGVAVCPIIPTGSQTLTAGEGDLVANLSTAPSSSTCMLQERLMLTIQGDYANIVRFLEALKHLNRYAELTNFKIARVDRPDETGAVSDRLQSTIEVTYYFKDKDKSLKVDSMLSTPVGMIMLTGKLDADTIAKFKDSITNRSFIPLSVDGSGKSNLFMRQ